MSNAYPAVVTIPDLPAGTTLSGAELLEAVQTSGGVGQSIQISVSQIGSAVGGLPVGGGTGQFLQSSGTGLVTQWANIASNVLASTGLAKSGSTTVSLSLASTAGLSVLGVGAAGSAVPAPIVGTADQVLIITHAGNTAQFGAVNLATSAAVTGVLSTSNMTAVNLAGAGGGGVQGVLPVPNGGTNTSTLTSFGVIYGQGTSTVGITAAGATSQLLVAQGAAAPKYIDQWLNIEAYGGGTAVADNSLAYTTALAALTGSGGNIYFPPGKYNFNSSAAFNYPAGIFSVGLVGAGQDATILAWANQTGGLVFNYSGANSSFHIRDLSLTTKTTGGGSALVLNNASANVNPAVTAATDIYRTTIRGDDGYSVTDYWSVGVNIANVSNIQIDDLTINGPAVATGIGINLVGLPTASTYGTNYNIAKSVFNTLSIAINYGSWIQGLTCDQCIFIAGAGTSIGINVPSNATGTLDEIAITNTNFNVTKALNIGTAVNHLLFSNNYVILNANSIGVLLSNGVAFNCVGNHGFAGTTTGTFMFALEGTTQNGTLTGNTVTGAGTGILMQAGVSNTVVSGNVLAACSSPISNSATAVNNTIINNPGYNPVGVAVATHSSTLSPFGYLCGPTPQTLYVSTSTSLVSAVVGGTNVLPATLGSSFPLTVDLGPNEIATFNYSGVLTVITYTH